MSKLVGLFTLVLILFLTNPVFAALPSTPSGQAQLVVSANLASGWYNLLPVVTLTASDPAAAIYFTSDGTVPSATNGTHYTSPVAFDGHMKAIAISGSVQSQIAEWDFRYLTAPTRFGSCWCIPNGVQITNPIQTGITRTAFLFQNSLHFSTLENSNSSGNNQFLMYQYDTQASVQHSQVVSGSVEARSYSFSNALNKYVLGTSTNAQILLYDPLTQQSQIVFQTPGEAFIHGIATKDNFAYAILATRNIPLSGYAGILKVDLTTQAQTLIPFTDTMSQNWGLVQTVDPSGRIWFWRGYPLSLRWYDATGGVRQRSIPGYESWTIESWDTWGNDFFLILTNSSGAVQKLHVDPVTLAILPPVNLSTFNTLIPVNLYHQDRSLSAIYYNPTNFGFYRVDIVNQTMTLLGTRNLGTLNILGFLNNPTEPSLNWSAPDGTRQALLGLLNNKLLLWSVGEKSYTMMDLAAPPSPDIKTNIPALNLTPAGISGLVPGASAELYGGGYLTTNDMFKFLSDAGADSSLKGLWRFDEASGQTAADSTANMNNATVYNGAGWVPGQIFNGLAFNGSNSYASIPYSLALANAGDYTWAAWVKLNATGSIQAIMSNYKSTAPFAEILISRSNNLGITTRDASGAMVGFWGATSLSTGVWYHVAVTRSGSNLTLYLNGVADGAISNGPTGNTWDTNGNLTLGVEANGSATSFSYWLNGALDNLMIFNRALSAAEIAKLSQFGSGLLPQAVPHLQGQVNNLFKGLDGLVYGAGYPNSVIFKYNIGQPWHPGPGVSDNPTNLGPTGYHNQTRATNGVQDLDGNIWMSSRSDYSYPDVGALIKADFVYRTIVAKTDLDDNFPIIMGLAVYDATHILMLGKTGPIGSTNPLTLYWLNPRTFTITQQQVLPNGAWILADVGAGTGTMRRMLVASGNLLYQVQPDLSIVPIHTFVRDIVSILPGNGNDIILVGSNQIERFNISPGEWEIWWDSTKPPVFQTNMTLAVFLNGSLYFTDGDKLKRFLTP